MSAGNTSSGQKTTIVDNEVYDLLAALTNKLESLAEYNTYQKDGSANDSLWQELRQQDEQAVRKLLAQVEQFAQQGKLRAK